MGGMGEQWPQPELTPGRVTSLEKGLKALGASSNFEQTLQPIKG